MPWVARLTSMLVRFQTGVLECFAPLYAMPFVRGVAVTVGPSLAGEVAVRHKLGRKPNGWMVTDLVRGASVITDCSVYRRVNGRTDESVLTLYATTAFESLTLWVW